MAIYYVDSAATGANDGTSWTDAWTTPNSLPTTADGDTVYIASGSLDAHTYTAHKIFQGPTTGMARIISATTGTTNYAKATADQFKITGASTYDITFDGGWFLWGIQVNNTKGDVAVKPQAMEQFWAEECTFKPAHAFQFQCLLGTYYVFRDCTFDLANDTSATSVAPINIISFRAFFENCDFVNGTNRTGNILQNATSNYAAEFTGCDFSSFTNATNCEVIHENSNQMVYYFYGCKFKSGWTWETASSPPRLNHLIHAVNCGSSGDNPEYLYYSTAAGHLSDSTVNRTGGASVEGTDISWGPVETEAICDKDYPFYTPWIYPEPLGTTGSKTFDVYVQNNTADTTDTEQWLEVQVKETASDARWTTVTSRNANPFAAGTTNTDDVTSTWSSSQTYKQKLSITVTVNTAGIYRARVALALTSVAASENYYIDPKVTVS